MDHSLRQINCQKTVSGKDFGIGIQDFNFQIGGASVWNPSKSFFSVTMRLQTRDNNVLGQPSESKQIALADNVVSCLYDNIHVQGGGQSISNLVSFCPQASQIRQRLTKSGAWLQSQGKDAWGLNSSFKSRVQQISKGDIPGIDELEKINVATPTHEYDRTIAVATGTGIVTGVNTDFDGSVARAAATAAGAAIFPAVPKVRVGDICAIKVAGDYTYHQVTVVTGATTLTISPPTTADVVANINFFFARSEIEHYHKNTQTVLWQPPTGIFDVDTLGAGDYRISLNPNARYKQAAVECIANLPVYNSDAPANGTFDFEILDVKLYLALSKQVVKQSGITEIFLREQTLQSKPITGLENSMDFTVPPSTNMLVFMIQSGKNGSDLRYSPTTFKAENNYELSLESFQLTYDNKSRPSTRWASEFTEGKNTLIQRYNDTFSEADLSDLQGGTESFQDWIKRGPIYCYRFTGDTSSKSTQVQLNINVKQFAPNTSVVLCAFYSKSVTIAYDSGQIVEVISASV